MLSAEERQICYLLNYKFIPILEESIRSKDFHDRKEQWIDEVIFELFKF
jgi:hypothetical protein